MVELGLDGAIKDTRTQIDHAHFLGLEFLMTFGVDDPKQYADYYRLMADADAALYRAKALGRNRVQVGAG